MKAKIEITIDKETKENLELLLAMMNASNTNNNIEGPKQLND